MSDSREDAVRRILAEAGSEHLAEEILAILNGQAAKRESAPDERLMGRIFHALDAAERDRAGLAGDRGRKKK